VSHFASCRSALSFAHPDAFIPERWLPVSSPLFAPTASDPIFDKTTFSEDKTDIVQPFSIGPRNCIGKYLATLEVRLIMAKLLWHFDPTFSADISKDERLNPFDNNKTRALWLTKPFRVEMVPVKR
jgi:cytochrome P450